MSESFSSTVTYQRRKVFSAVLSVVLHGAAVALAVSLPSSFSLPKAREPVHLSIVHLVYVAQKPRSSNSGEAGTRAPGPPRIVANGSAALGETIQSRAGKVEIGALDRFRVEARPTVGRGAPVEVLVGGLSGGTAGGRQFEPVGTVGPTDVFNSPGPTRKQTVMLVQQGGDEAAKLLSAPTPMYNDEAKRLNVTGEVVLEVKMRASGEVQVLRIVSSLGHGLDQAAIDAVNQTRCRPALKAGRPVDVMATVRVIFKLA